jgi:hypothetical protein
MPDKKIREAQVIYQVGNTDNREPIKVDWIA